MQRHSLPPPCQPRSPEQRRSNPTVRGACSRWRWVCDRYTQWLAALAHKPPPAGTAVGVGRRAAGGCATVAGAFFLNLCPWGSWGWVPDFVALTLVFWSIYQPRRVGIGVAFMMGLIMDVHSASLLGENALAY
eukprot:gene19960-28252_t